MWEAGLIGHSSLRFWNKLDIKVRKGQNRFIIFMSDVEESGGVDLKQNKKERKEDNMRSKH